jgi:hypothetical protein
MGQTLQGHYSEHDILKGKRAQSTPDCMTCQNDYSRTLLALAGQLAEKNARIEQLKVELSLARGLLGVAAQRLNDCDPDALAQGFDETA